MGHGFHPTNIFLKVLCLNVETLYSAYTQRSLQIVLIFRLLLKITVERPHECDFDLICARREPVKQNDPPGSHNAPPVPPAPRLGLGQCFIPGCRTGQRPSVTQVGTKATRIRRLCVALGLACAPRVCPIQGSGQ